MTTTSPDYYEKQSAQDSRMAVLETKVQDLEEQLERFKDKDQEELNDRLRKLEKWVWGAGAVIASLVTVFGIYSNVHTVPTFAEAEHKHGSYITTFDFLKWSNITK
jgi:hypothetical protein|tara:strand:- start:257 stop:574 length:318 start_codon:yes stop_codon:yes gene_type:complete